MSAIKFTMDEVDWLPAVAAIEMETRQKVRLVLETVGRDTVAYLRSLTGEMRPPARTATGRMTGPRRAHPGGWADVSSQLSNSYGWSLDEDRDSVTLTLTNGAEYAAALEARDGFFVLSGVTDPGGPVHQALERVAAAIAPDWEVRYG